MRTHFWNTLLSQLSDAQVVQDIGAAWLAGILFRYGTPFDAGFPGMLGLRNDSALGSTCSMDSWANIMLCDGTFACFLYPTEKVKKEIEVSAGATVAVKRKIKEDRCTNFNPVYRTKPLSYGVLRT